MVNGIRRIPPSVFAALGLLSGSGLGDPFHGVPVTPNPRRDRLWKEAEARDRERRRKAREEQREQRLRQRIATGKDGRPDKYLHAAARRRREAERAAAINPRATGMKGV